MILTLILSLAIAVLVVLALLARKEAKSVRQLVPNKGRFEEAELRRDMYINSTIEMPIGLVEGLVALGCSADIVERYVKTFDELLGIARLEPYSHVHISGLVIDYGGGKTEVLHYRIGVGYRANWGRDASISSGVSFKVKGTLQDPREISTGEKTATFAAQ